MNKQEIVDEIVKEISMKVREIIREEFDIETRRFRKKLLREVNAMLTEHRRLKPGLKKPVSGVNPLKQQIRKVQHFIEEEVEQDPQDPRFIPQRPKPKIETGDPTVDALLQETILTEQDGNMIGSLAKPAVDHERMVFNASANPFQEVVKQVTRERGKETALQKFEGEFNPMHHDPSAMDWSEMMDRVDEQAKKSQGPA